MASVINIPGYVTITSQLTISDFSRLAADLLAANCDLPAPSVIRLDASRRQVDVELTAFPATFDAMAQWADRSAGIITGTPGAGKDGPYVCCQVQFTYRTAHVRAFAHVRSGSTCPSCGTDWDRSGDCQHVG
jgi:hypothetical protein